MANEAWAAVTGVAGAAQVGVAAPQRTGGEAVSPSASGTGVGRGSTRIRDPFSSSRETSIGASRHCETTAREERGKRREGKEVREREKRESVCVCARARVYVCLCMYLCFHTQCAHAMALSGSAHRVAIA